VYAIYAEIAVTVGNICCFNILESVHSSQCMCELLHHWI